MKKENFNIKGEYNFCIIFTNMFINYTLNVGDHNLVTSGGLEYFVNRVTKNLEAEELLDKIGQIAIGTCDVDDEPLLSDTKLMSETLDNGSFKKFKYTQPDTSTGYSIILTANATGNDLDRTTEIGVYTTKGTLISRDVHDTYFIPSSAIVTLTYTFTLGNVKTEELENGEKD